MYDETKGAGSSKDFFARRRQVFFPKPLEYSDKLNTTLLNDQNPIDCKSCKKGAPDSVKRRNASKKSVIQKRLAKSSQKARKYKDDVLLNS